MYFKCNWNIEKLKIKNGFQTIVCDPFFVTVSSTSLYESIIFYLLYAFQVQLVISSRFFTFALLLALKKLLLATKQLFLCFLQSTRKSTLFGHISNFYSVKSSANRNVTVYSCNLQYS